jgi:hypothetical protein
VDSPRRQSKREHMRRWRAANPDLARERNRQHVAAHRARKKVQQTTYPTIQFIDVPLDPQFRARLVYQTPVALAIRCLTCRWVGPGHRGLLTLIWPDARKHYHAEHPGKWEEQGPPLYEKVYLNANGNVIEAQKADA